VISGHRIWSPWRSAWVLVAAVVALRAVGFAVGVVNIDEADFAMVARMMTAGESLYTGIVDIKPPLAYVAYLPAAWSFPSLWPMRLVGMAALVGTCLAIGRAVRLWTGNESAGWGGAWCTLLASLCEVPSVNAELLMNLPCALALWAFARARFRGGWAAVWGAGLSVGVASLVKHQAAALLPALAVGFLWPGPAPRPLQTRWRRAAAALVLSLAAGIPWLVCLGWWSAHGQLPAFVDWVLARNFRYTVREPGSAGLRFAESFAVCVLGAAPLVWVAAVRNLRRPWDPARVTGLAALALAWVSVSLGGRFYEHYFLQFAPLLGFLGGPVVAEVAGRWTSLGSLRRAALGLFLVAPLVGYVGFTLGRAILRAYPGQRPEAAEIGQWVRAHSAPTDRLFVWGHHAPLYLQAGRLAGTRYLTTSVVVGNFDPGHLPPGFDVRPFVSGRDVQALLSDLRERRPEWVVDLSPANLHQAARTPMSVVPEVSAYVHSHYERVGQPAGAAVWRLKAPLSVAGLAPGLGVIPLEVDAGLLVLPVDDEDGRGAGPSPNPSLLLERFEQLGGLGGAGLDRFQRHVWDDSSGPLPASPKRGWVNGRRGVRLDHGCDCIIDPPDR
jgi:4-amino-4-deoxy-L-arabinose transferase-like glycosyltransferase